MTRMFANGYRQPLILLVLVVALCFLIFTPDIAAAQDGLVVCTNDCGWEEFVLQLNRIVTWLIGFATAISTLLFIYAGFMYLTSGGDQSKAEQAKGIFSNVVIGFVIILIAYLLVTTIVRILTDPDADFRDDEVSPVDLSIELPDELSTNSLA